MLLVSKSRGWQAPCNHVSERTTKSSAVYDHLVTTLVAGGIRGSERERTDVSKGLTTGL